jgi:hypothetical protein
LKILFDISHPAHVHFFKHPARLLQQRGHEVLFTSRDKDITLQLLDELGLQHRVLSSMGGKGMVSLAVELLTRNRALYKVVKAFKPDVMASIGGTFIAHVGFLSGVPSLVFYDTENATLQNAITYPLASCVIVPRCYQAWLPKKRHIRYAGYHELSYLAPNRFSPDKEIAIANGLDPERPNYFIRLVSWQANHDIGEGGWNVSLLEKVVASLAENGRVHISAEAGLPDQFAEANYRGDVAAVHHVMGFCELFIGESATMASECAVLGVPAIYVANTGRGYTDEQEKRYKLVANVAQLEWRTVAPALEKFLDYGEDQCQRLRQQLLADCVDVAEFVVESILDYRQMLATYQSGNH